MMCAQSQKPGVIESGLLVPSHEIENFLAVGWWLGEEPICGTVRMFPVVGGVHRVPSKKMAAEQAAKRIDDNAGHRTSAAGPQAK